MPKNKKKGPGQKGRKAKTKAKAKAKAKAQTKPGQVPETDDVIRYDVGIDVGAINTKLILLKDRKTLLEKETRPTSMEPGRIARDMLDQVLKKRKINQKDISHIVATGQGRKSIKFADMARTEITAFSKAVNHYCPEAEVAADIGGHGVRVMKMGEMGIISDFRTNDKCSTGTGCFIDTMAVALKVGIEEVGDLSLTSKDPERISCSCTVFGESEVVSLVAKGKPREDILAGLNQMVARRIRAMINSMRGKGTVFIGGGVALNQGIVESLKDLINRELYIPEEPMFTGAFGAALLAPLSDVEDEMDDYYDEEDPEKKEGGILARFFSRFRGKGK